jgi:hypothetical protein
LELLISENDAMKNKLNTNLQEYEEMKEQVETLNSLEEAA